MRPLKTLFSISGDPGGAAAIAPVLLSLSEMPEWALQNFSYFCSGTILEKCHLSHSALNAGTTRSDIEKHFDQCQPSFVLTGTSVNGQDLEHDFIEEATVRDIPSLSVLDFWSNYKTRFISSRTGSCIVPTKIAIMDDFARDDMIREGFNPSQLVITGQPALDCATPSQAAKNRQSFELLESELVVAFLSQTTIPGIDASHAKYPGFSKMTVLPLLLTALNEIQRKTSRRITLVVRPHPREAEETFEWIDPGAVSVRIIRSGSSRALASACDLIVGLNSILLVECCLMGLPVLSLQPGLRGGDCLPTNRMGFSQAIYDAEKIPMALENLLVNDMERARMRSACLAWNLPRDATRRVADLVFAMTA